MERRFALNASYALVFPHVWLRGIGVGDMLANQKQWHSEHVPCLRWTIGSCGHGRYVMQVLMLDKGARKRAGRSIFHSLGGTSHSIRGMIRVTCFPRFAVFPPACEQYAPFSFLKKATPHKSELEIMHSFGIFE